MEPRGDKAPAKPQKQEHAEHPHPDVTSSRRNIEDALGSMGKKLAANRRSKAGLRPERERLPRRELDKQY